MRSSQGSGLTYAIEPHSRLGVHADGVGVISRKRDLCVDLFRIGGTKGQYACNRLGSPFMNTFGVG